MRREDFGLGVRENAAALASPEGVAWDWALKAAIMLALGLLIYGTAAGRFLQPLLHEAELRHWPRFLRAAGLFWALLGIGLMLLRTLLWFRYRPHPAAQMGDAPRLTVIIPAYNEGAMVAHSIDSVAAARYPADRLEILVVDDGSQDDTWTHIEAASCRHRGRITAIRFDRNRGKRAALAEGFRRARGDVVLTIDSDSVIEPDTLLAMTGPFRNPRGGAVAGRVHVYNRDQGLIPRMLNVRFTLTFDVLRAVQSTYGTVYCCPGALAAYRTSVVRTVLARWVDQTFLGAACTFGEDRALTNYILAERFDAVYQRTGIVHTLVPVTYARLCKMFLRWDRSYVREELRFARILWSRPWPARVVSLVDAGVTNGAYLMGYGSLALLLSAATVHPILLLHVLAGIGLMSAINMLYYLRAERSWRFVYGIVYGYYSALVLFWILPYAAITVRARSWLTR